MRRLFRYPPLIRRIAKDTGVRAFNVALVAEVLMDDGRRLAAEARCESAAAVFADLVASAAARITLPDEKVREVAIALLEAGSAAFHANQPSAGSAN